VLHVLFSSSEKTATTLETLPHDTPRCDLRSGNLVVESRFDDSGQHTDPAYRHGLTSIAVEDKLVKGNPLAWRGLMYRRAGSPKFDYTWQQDKRSLNRSFVIWATTRITLHIADPPFDQ
jgi:hypothetical protein